MPSDIAVTAVTIVVSNLVTLSIAVYTFRVKLEARLVALETKINLLLDGKELR